MNVIRDFPFFSNPLECKKQRMGEKERREERNGMVEREKERKKDRRNGKRMEKWILIVVACVSNQLNYP